MERRSMQEHRAEPQHYHKVRHSTGDIARDVHDPLGRHASSTRKRAESYQARATTSSRALSPSEMEQLPQQALISAYLRSSCHGDGADHQGRLSSTAASYYTPPSWHHHDTRRISGHFNAPTEIEVERQRSHRRRSRGMGKLKDAVKGLVVRV